MRIGALVSAYYCKDFLPGRFDNLLAQTPRPLIVVICEKDSGEYFISWQYAAKHKDDFVLVTTDDIPTVYEAWNLGIKATKGQVDFYTSANSDDRHYPGAFAKLLKLLKRNPDRALAYSDVDRVQGVDGPKIGEFNFMEGGFAELLQGCFIGPMPLWKADLHDKYGYFDPEYTSAGDYEFWLRLARNGEKFLHVGVKLGAHAERSEAIEHRSPVKSIWEAARARSAHKEKP